MLNESIYPLLKNNKSIPTYLKNQLGRASLSILLNIAEGSGRQTNKDRKNFLVNARGSTFECAAIINFLYDRKEIENTLKTKLYSEFDQISRMLYAMIDNIEKRS